VAGFAFDGVVEAACDVGDVAAGDGGDVAVDDAVSAAVHHASVLSTVGVIGSRIRCERRLAAVRCMGADGSFSRL